MKNVKVLYRSFTVKNANKVFARLVIPRFITKVCELCICANLYKLKLQRLKYKNKWSSRFQAQVQTILKTKLTQTMKSSKEAL